MAITDSAMGNDALVNASTATTVYGDSDHPVVCQLRRMRKAVNEARRIYRTEYVAMSVKDLDTIEDEGSDVDAMRHEFGGKVHDYVREARLIIHDAGFDEKNEADALRRLAMSVSVMRDTWEETRYFYPNHKDVMSSLPDDQRIRLPTKGDPRFAMVGEKRAHVDTTTATQESNFPDAARFRSSSPRDDTKGARMPSFSMEQGSPDDGTTRRSRKGISPVVGNRVGEWVDGQAKVIPEIVIMGGDEKGNLGPLDGGDEGRLPQPPLINLTNDRTTTPKAAPPPPFPSSLPSTPDIKDGGVKTKAGNSLSRGVKTEQLAGRQQAIILSQREEQAKLVREQERAKAEAEAQARAQAQAKAQADADAKRALIQAQEQIKIVAQRQAQEKAEAEAREKAQTQALIQAQARAQAQAQAEAQARAQAEEQARARARAQAQAEEQARIKAQAEALARTLAQAKAEAEARAQAQAQAQIHAQTQAQAQSQNKNNFQFAPTTAKGCTATPVIDRLTGENDALRAQMKSRDKQLAEMRKRMEEMTVALDSKSQEARSAKEAEVRAVAEE